MTHTRNTAASPADGDETTLPAEGFSGRAYRARAEPMTIRQLRDGRYVVETRSGTYVVDLDARSCTCPDHAIRGSRCKHLRRVAIEVTHGRLPAPDERRVVCAICGDETVAGVEEPGPYLCDRHTLHPGELVEDRETEKLLVVTAVRHERADEVATEEGRLVADYESNAEYGDHEPVVDAVYVESLRFRDGEFDLDRVTQYSFPASRLRRVDDW